MRLPACLRLVFLFCVAVLANAVLAPPVHAAPYAAIVMDMRNGEVLHARSADRRQQPASLTKMMTLYLTFEAVESGRFDLDQRVRVSRHAARQVPSKVYLKEGQRVSIRHLIRATATKSANDAAMVLAEAIGGSQAGFARMMTEKARALGMRSTTFKNPHGLTQSGHLSTARDMALLARHLYFDFPEYYHVFGRIKTYAMGKTLWSTNRRLLRSYRGAEGMKTGYTRAAGYNLVGIAKRGSERVIAVVMGENSVPSRTRRVAELLDMGFARAATHVAEVPPRRGTVLAAVSQAPVPPARPAVGATGLAAIAKALGPASAVAATRENRESGKIRVARVPVPNSPHAPHRTAVPALRPVQSSDAVLVAEGAAQEFPVPPPRPVWSVRLGAFADRAAAVESVAAVTIGDGTLLASAQSEISQYKGDDGEPLYEVRFTGLSPHEAGNACSELKTHGRDCVALAPN